MRTWFQWEIRIKVILPPFMFLDYLVGRVVLNHNGKLKVLTICRLQSFYIIRIFIRTHIHVLHN
jgi:hypothetical protein